MASKQLSDLRKLQRNQLLKINKEELIDYIVSFNDENDALTKITRRLDEVMDEMQSLKNMITSLDSQMNKAGHTRAVLTDSYNCSVKTVS